MTLNKDAKFGKSFWASKGEKVKVVGISGNAITCENKKGLKFPCNIKDLE
ncbi:hypothetical protein BCF58_0268 [Chryseobacterium defluvii]|uniref:Uncharacterized protein n=2 Tax=Chryseobacterium defluvii TaxID=160396 RepID=A0A495SLY6_9FLAO|nr:hypothetical protein BCF58_0268 [Chryseobacterium defluvii]